jgi:hypothetical protein
VGSKEAESRPAREVLGKLHYLTNSKIFFPNSASLEERNDEKGGSFRGQASARSIMKIKNQNGEWVDIRDIPKLKLMPCPDCRKEVSVNAMNCPHCGRKLKQSAVGILAVVILVLIVLGFVFWLLSQF